MKKLPEEVEVLKRKLKELGYKDHNNTKYRSSVAIILRENKELKNEKNKLEILYILRQFRPKDEWSGQVGLPGGIKQKNETDQEAVIREVKEEIGLDLNNLEYIGRLNTFMVKNSLLLTSPFGIFLIFTIVYFTSENLNLQLNPKEVRDIRWTPISFLTSEKPESVTSKISFSMYISNPYLKDIFGGDGMVTMNGIYLQTFEWMNGDKTLKKDFFLWGLTMRITNFLLKILGYSEICSEAYFSDNIKLAEFLNLDYSRSKL